MNNLFGALNLLLTNEKWTKNINIRVLDPKFRYSKLIGSYGYYNKGDYTIRKTNSIRNKFEN